MSEQRPDEPSPADDEQTQYEDESFGFAQTKGEPEPAQTKIAPEPAQTQVDLASNAAAPVESRNDQTIAEVPENDRTLAEPVPVADANATLAEGDSAALSGSMGGLRLTFSQTGSMAGPAGSMAGPGHESLLKSTVARPQMPPSEYWFGQAETKQAPALPGQPAAAPTKAQRELSADRYSLVDNFAKGGLGNIWLAEDRALRRQVAFKELLPKALRNKVIVERFLEEAQITGQLEHPGIIPIYDIGLQENGTPFYAMKLLKGGNMDQAIEALHHLPPGSTERQLAFTRLLRQFVAVCQAVGFAHEKGVLHRDLKPLNVMLGEFGETLVLDWGLAKLIDIIGERQVHSDRADAHAPDDDFLQSDASTDEQTLSQRISAEQATRTAIQASQVDAAHSGVTGSTSASGATSADGVQPSTMAASAHRHVSTSGRSAGSQTIMGQVMGTPAYMPPEQALGKIDQLDPRTDIYSLGGILYKVLTNQQPVPRGKMKDVMQVVIEGRIKPPRELDPRVPAPLDAICRKAMSRQQSDRYQTAMQLAADVEKWLADEPVSCFAEPWTEKARRWVKRHWTLVVSSAAAAIVIGIGATLWTTIESRRIENLRSAALAKSAEAKSAIEAADFTQATSLLNEAIGQVKHEVRLADVRSSLESRLDDVGRLQAAAERERVANVRQKAERRLNEIAADLDAQANLPNCQVVLTEVVTLLANETTLSELREQAAERLKRVDQLLTQRAEIDAAAVRFANFEQEVEQTRLFGGRISGEDSLDDVRQARDHGLAALELFALDPSQSSKLDPRLALLPEATVARWRAGVGEVLVTLAQLELKLGAVGDATGQAAAAKRALARLDEAERFGIASPPVWYLRADLYFLLGDKAAADAAQVAAAKQPPQTRLDHFLLGERSRALRKYDDALLHYQNALRADPDDFWSLNLMGLCHLLSGRHAAAAASYTACISRRPDFVWPYVTRAVAFGEMKQFDNAFRDFDKALELDPESYAAYLNRGVVQVLNKQLAAAQTDFEKAAQLDPQNAAPHINLAEVRWRSGSELLTSDSTPAAATRAAVEFQKGLADLTTAAKLSPQQASIYFFRGQIQAALNHADAARADLDKSVRLESHPVRRAAGLKELGRLHHRENRFEDALAAYNQSLAGNPRDADVVRLRAEALLSLGQFDEAAKAFTKFLELSGPVGDVYRARGLAFAKLKKYREAINDYTMSLQFEPSPNMLTRRGWAYLNEAAKLAKEDFEEATQLNPNNPDTIQGLAYALVMLGDHAKAAQTLEKADTLLRDDPKAFGDQLWILHFNPATTYAQAYARALVDPQLFDKNREELTESYLTKAIRSLNKAKELSTPRQSAAFRQVLKAESALDPIRNTAEFTKFLEQVEKN